MQPRRRHSRSETPSLQCAFVDITASVGYIARLEHLDPPAPVLVDVGLAPGLTNLLAAALHHDSAGPIDIAVLIGAGERPGATATDWSYRQLGKHFRNHDRKVRNYTRPKVSIFPGTAAGDCTGWISPTSTA